jgi:hypothetical protein
MRAKRAESPTVEIVPPVSGWGILRVTHGSRVVEFWFSYVPRDSIEMLVEAVDAVVTGPGERSVVFSAGSEELDVVFAREANTINVRFVLCSDGRRDMPGEERLSFALDAQGVGKLFWRALRQLQSKVGSHTYEQAWHYPFPQRLVAQLGSRLKG